MSIQPPSSATMLKKAKRAASSESLAAQLLCKQVKAGM
jgi:hypothetical protein